MKKARVPESKRATKAYTVGRHAFARISAVEGIRLTDSMDEDFREFERQGLSSQERRAALSKKYAKTR
jgi:hypothetical protein